MYCIKCGKQIDYDAKICKECEAKEVAEAQTITEANVATENQTQNVIITPQVEPKEKRSQKNQRAHNAGFGLALASVVMVPIALIMFAIYYSETYNCVESLYLGKDSSLVGDLIINYINVVAIIIAFIMGIVMTSKAYREQGEIVKNGGVRHTATFVLATVGRVLSIFALVIVGETLLSLIKLIF
ncbi:MAG: hypothetical protein E7353_09420 [Clostridiales bacterium]|nr:hypothetical protein [Clostridiales bacterium]